MVDLGGYRNPDGQICVNVASAIYTLDGFVNFDSDPRLRILSLYPVLKPVIPQKYHSWIEAYRDAKAKGHVVMVHDCRKPLPFPPGSVNHILCSHFLEHLYPIETETVLRDFFAKLKPGGTIDIIVPDIGQLAERYLRRLTGGDADARDKFMGDTVLSRRTRGTPLYRLLEMLGGFGLQHRWMYDRQTMSRRIVDAGFTIVQSENRTPSRTFRLPPPGALEVEGEVRIVAAKPH